MERAGLAKTKTKQKTKFTEFDGGWEGIRGWDGGGDRSIHNIVLVQHSVFSLEEK